MKINWKAFFICIFNNSKHTTKQKHRKVVVKSISREKNESFKASFLVFIIFSLFYLRWIFNSYTASCLVILTCWSTEWNVNFKFKRFNSAYLKAFFNSWVSSTVCLLYENEHILEKHLFTHFSFIRLHLDFIM
jgi:hypothetical protein